MPRAKKTDGTKPAPKKPPAKSHVLAKPLPVGTKLADYKKCEWVIGRHIGQGGFGLIYAAKRASDSGSEERHVVKIEPKSNGPLFCETHFYRNVRLDHVSDWKKKKNLKCLGIPTDVSSGSHEEGSTEYRFLVIERCGEDLQKLFERNGRRFPAPTALTVALKVIDALEFIHSMGYVHADIKAANLLLGLPPDENEIFLVDFGLAFRFSRDGKAAPYKEDPRRRHDGTLEFCSRDAHRGANPAPRGDLETLAFCMLQWLGGQLPWDPLIGPSNQAKERVFEKKETCMKDVKELAKSCSAATMPDFVKFLEAVAALTYEEKIDYDRMRGFLQGALRRLGVNAKNYSLTFDTQQRNNISNSKSAARKRPQAGNDANSRPAASRVKSPASRVKSPASRVKSPASRPKTSSSSTLAISGKLVNRTNSPAVSPGSRMNSPARLNSPLASSQKRPKLTSPGPTARNAGSQTSPGLLQALRAERRLRRQQQKS